MRRILPRVAALSLVVCGCGFNWKFYHPDTEHTDIEWGDTQQGFIETGGGDRLHFAFAKPDDGQARATVFALHGNGGNLASCGPLVTPFVDNGLSVFVFDYPGYGQSEGRPTHASVLQASHDALTYLLSRPEIEDTKILVAGFSLGGQLGIVLTAARQDEVDALLVEGTFGSHDDIAAHATRDAAKPFARAFVRAPYEAKESIRTITIPKLIIHSRDDAVVPYAMGVELYENAAPPKTFWPIDGPHMDGFARYGPQYLEKVERLLQLPPHSGPHTSGP